MAEVRARHDREQAEQFAAAKADAAARGKEPFDIDRLSEMCDITLANTLRDPDECRSQHERFYYMHYPDVQTLAEYAERVTELNRWW